jgi:hypothetical protein
MNETKYHLPIVAESPTLYGPRQEITRSGEAFTGQQGIQSQESPWLPQSLEVC